MLGFVTFFGRRGSASSLRAPPSNLETEAFEREAEIHVQASCPRCKEHAEHQPLNSTGVCGGPLSGAQGFVHPIEGCSLAIWAGAGGTLILNVFLCLEFSTKWSYGKKLSFLPKNNQNFLSYML